jgi:hypothetical protein
MKYILGTLTMTALVCVALTTTGCRSTNQPYSASFASVEITGRTLDQIRSATVTVFREDGFATKGTSSMTLECNREGTRMNKFAYGDWVGNSGVMERVKVEIVQLSADKYRVQCNAYMVRDPGGLEDEVKLAHIRRAPYQSLMNKIAARLK